MPDISCLFNKYHFRHYICLPDDYDYKTKIEEYKNIFLVDIVTIDLLVNIEDINQFIEKLARRLLTLCEEYSVQNFTQEELLKDVLIPYFFNNIEGKSREFDRSIGSQYLSWFPIKKTQTDKRHKFLTEHIMKTNYPKTYKFHQDMTSWRQHSRIMRLSGLSEQDKKQYFGLPNYFTDAVKSITRQNREKYFLIPTSDEPSFDFFVRILIILDSLDPYPDHPVLITFFLDFWHYFGVNYCGL